MNIGKSQFSIVSGASNPKFLTAIVIFLCIGFLCVSTILAFVLGKTHKVEDTASNARAALAAVHAAQRTNESDAKLVQEQLKQLTQSLTNSIAELRAAKEKLESYEIAEQERQRTSVATKPSPTLEAARIPQTNQTKRIQVYEILHDYVFLKCRTQIGEIGIKNLPREVGQYLGKVKQMRAEYARLSADVEQKDRVARRANATALTSAGGDAAYVDAAMAERRRANLMTENVQDAKIALAKYKESLTSWENAVEEQTTIFAIQTPQNYAGVQIWQFTGMAGKLAEGISR